MKTIKNLSDVDNIIGNASKTPTHVKYSVVKEDCYVKNKMSKLYAKAGDVIILKSDGELYPVDPDEFSRKYDIRK